KSKTRIEPVELDERAVCRCLSQVPNMCIQCVVGVRLSDTTQIWRKRWRNSRGDTRKNQDVGTFPECAYNRTGRSITGCCAYEEKRQVQLCTWSWPYVPRATWNLDDTSWSAKP